MSKNYLLGFTILFLTACGGSGSGPSGSSSTGPSNAAPVISSGNTYSVAENTTAIGTVQASDADGDALAYFIQGDDSSLVTLTGNVLSFTTAPDFEAPADANSDNVYKVTVVVSDGSAKDAKDLEISVTNVNEGPQLIVDSSYTVAENTATVATATVSDSSSAVTFSLTGTDSAAMTIGASSGVLAFAANPDFEAPADSDGDNVYNVTITATDDAGSNSEDVTVTVTDVVECTGACDLFISEYAEGSSNNKYLEIANFTGAEVALSGYALPSVGNAPTTAGEYEFWNGDIFGANDTIADGDVYVVCHGSAAQAILDRCDSEHNFLSNGDDGRKLVKGTEDSYTVVDVFGDFQGDPGSGWDICGVENGTKDHTVVKKEGKEGNADWTSSRGTTADDCDWIVADNDAFLDTAWDGLGSHCYNSANDAVSFTSSATFSVAENSTAVGTVVAGVVGCNTSETVTMALSGADSALFTIDAAGALAFAAAPDFEVTGSASGTNDYTVVVTATVGTDSVDATLTVSVTDVDEKLATEADFSGSFAGAVVEGNNYTFPTGAEGYAGFSNNNAALYPFSFPNGGTVTFTASAAVATNVNFRFEKAPYPDVDPAFSTENVTISGEEKSYSVEFGAQGENTFASLLMYIVERDQTVMVKNVVIAQKAAEPTGLVPDFGGTFNGTVFDSDTNTYTFPSSAADYAGFSNDNADLYPLSFSEAGKVTFNGSAPDGDVIVRFRFEANPYPNVDPAYNTESVTVSGTESKAYEVAVPSQGSNTFNSALLYLNTRDIGVVMTDIQIFADTPDPESCGNRGEALTAGNGGGLADMCEAFAGTTYNDDTKTYGYPTGGGVEDYAGFANKDTSIYPIKLGGGATITFDASTESALDTVVKFKFEKAPYPGNNPEFFTNTATISGSTEKQYSITVPAQDASVEWSSFLFYLETRNTTVVVKNINVVPN